MKTSNLYCSVLALVLLGCVLPSRAEDLSTNAVTAAWIPWGDSTCVSNEDVLFSPWPDWMVSAFKIGGAWNTNIPAWVVEAGDTNEAALNIEVDRIHLTNNVLMQLDYVDHSNATLMLDLYGFPGTNDPNEPVFTSNLFNNLLSGGGGVTSRTFTIPFGLYTNATGIRLRRDAGAMTIFDTLLSSDCDGDGYSDSEELAWGSDLDSALSVPCAAITGQVFYAGVQTGVIHVLATTNSSDWASAHYLTMGIPGVYTLSGLALRQTWYPRAFRDVNGNGIPDDWEPRGGYVAPNGANSLILADNSGGVNITMTDPDSDGDGVSDAVERALGLDPYTSNSFSHLPFLENFETNTVHLGDVNGQNGWFASPSNTVMVQTSTVYEGSQALALKNGDTPANVHQLFAVSNAPVVWLDVHVQALEGAIPTNQPSGSALMFFDANGYLKVYNGLSASSNKWVSLTNMSSCGTTGTWMRLTTKMDYSAQQWLVCVDGMLAAQGLGFATPVSQFRMVSLSGGKGGVDALAISTNQPSGLSLDGDHLPDDWEMAHLGNLDQTDDGDSDHDGLTNFQEFRAGTDPTQWSTVNDGIPDGWKVAHGLNSLDPAVASQDPDQDGLSNLGEYLAGTNPQNASSHCWNITGTVAYTGPQTGLVWVAACTAPTGGASVAQVSCVTTGAYTLAGLPPNSNYWIRAWVDTDGNGSNDFWEAQGIYTNNPVVLHTNMSGVNMILTDPDSDGDGTPDWWEIAHGLNPTNAADAAMDVDGDGLSNLEEYRHGTDPRVADTDHDGVNDGTEVQYGSNPLVANTCSQLPFIERFETNTVHVGDINGQNGWSACPSSTILVQTSVVWEGSQALAMKSSADMPANLSLLFAVSNAPVVWMDVHVQATESAIPTNAVSGSAMMFFDGNGYLKAYDGASALSNKWVTLTNVTSCGMTGAWVRLTTKLDYAAQRWLVCVDGILAGDGLGFATSASHFTAVSLKGSQGGMDALTITTNQPAGLSLDGDHLPDDWEMANFGSLDQVDSGDPDHDGLTNLQEYRLGTDPNVADSDHDGMPDGWEVSHGLNPTNEADASLDADGDGLANLAEYQYGADPQMADTDHDGLGDGVEVNTWHSNPLMMDSDGDGYADADEVVRGTDPADPASHPASHWLNHRKLMFREGSLTNRLADVPILVRLTPERIDYTQCAANGRDIFFTDSAGLPLDFEMERWKPGGESFFWVCLPEAGGTNSAGYFWLHWNYPDATNSANAASVWSTNYLGVWHLAETNTVLADSTLGTYAATNVGAVSVTGILGNARNFRGSDSVIVPPAALATISNAVSISFWQFGATNQPLGVTCFEGTSVIGRELNAHVPWSDGNVYWDAFGNYDRINKLTTTNLYKGGWNYWTFIKDRATGIMRIYVNGELWHSGTGKTRAYSPVTSFRFGSAANGSSGYVGMLDELRVESVAQTADWVRFQYKAMLDQVLIYGEQQVSIVGTGNGAEPDQAGEFTVMRPVSDNTNLALTVNLAAPGGTATEGADYSFLPRSVVIPAGASQATFSVPVIDDLWLEGAETVTVAIAPGNYFVSPTNATASIAIGDDDVDSDEDGMCDA
ncbi:MAG: LamG-like jellyroll fold domain-containing protein, partial [bacterium]